MVRHNFAALLMTLAIAASMSSAAENVSDDWHKALQIRCPSQHVDWACDGCYEELVTPFEETLSKPMRRNIERAEDIRRRCAGEWGGFGCEWQRTLSAYRKLGLMTKFAAYGCRHYSCAELSVCSRHENSNYDTTGK